MKKIFSFVIVLMILVVALGFSVGSASARSITPENPVPVVRLNSLYFDGLTPGVQLDAQMFVDSNFKDVYCVVKNTGEVAC